MKTKLLVSNPQKSWMVIFEAGEEATASLLNFARRENLGASQFTGIGAFSAAELGYFNMEKRDYERIPISEQVEALTFLGDITLGESGPKIHAHVVLGKRDGTAWGGHLLHGIVRPTLELIVTESPAHLRRRYDPVTGLALIEPRLES